MKFALFVTLDLPESYRIKYRGSDVLAAWVKSSYLDFGARFQGGITEVELFSDGFPVGSLVCHFCGRLGFSSPCKSCEQQISRMAKEILASPPLWPDGSAVKTPVGPLTYTESRAPKSARGWLNHLNPFTPWHPLDVVVWLAGSFAAGFWVCKLLIR